MSPSRNGLSAEKAKSLPMSGIEKMFPVGVGIEPH
jgi:hypothetical protein